MSYSFRIQENQNGTFETRETELNSGRNEKKISAELVPRDSEKKVALFEKLRSFDYSKYFGNLQPTAKRLLIEKCMRYGVPVFVDDANETVAG